MLDLKERLKLVLREKGETVNSFSDKYGYSQRNLNRYVKEGTTVGLDALLAILQAYPDVSVEWLILGEGEPFQSPVSQTQNGGASNTQSVINGNNHKITNTDIGGLLELQKGYQAMLMKKEEQIDRLLNMIERLAHPDNA